MKNGKTDSQTYCAIDLAKFVCSILVVMIHTAPFGISEAGGIFSSLNFGVQQVELPNSVVFKILRTLSSLIFYLHLWVRAIVIVILRIFNETLINTWLLSFLTLFITIICSLVIIKLSKLSKFKWLKKIYS